eukprot:TRINITY_DN7444_c0_g1_i1.p1 TRINITY_DN7444_c0_g1~~TRINITY_DN7444_c0_g1_i1.p1  ORF type:complete len:271 (+),score=24.41 TRINITY_DN7444_c0_g1_i1:43-855(+)
MIVTLPPQKQLTNPKEILQVYRDHLKEVESTSGPHIKTGKYHEHFVLSESNLHKLTSMVVKRDVWVEHFFDTKDRLLLGKNYWLKLVTGTYPTPNKKPDKWSLKKCIVNSEKHVVHMETTNTNEILEELKKEIIPTGDGSSVIHYCDYALAVFENIRYYIVDYEHFKFWVDVATFDDYNKYVIGTIESSLAASIPDLTNLNTIMCSSSLSASRAVAYLYKTNSKHFSRIINGVVPSGLSFYCYNPFGYFPQKYINGIEYEWMREEEEDED